MDAKPRAQNTKSIFCVSIWYNLDAGSLFWWNNYVFKLFISKNQMVTFVTVTFVTWLKYSYIIKLIYQPRCKLWRRRSLVFTIRTYLSIKTTRRGKSALAFQCICSLEILFVSGKQKGWISSCRRSSPL